MNFIRLFTITFTTILMSIFSSIPVFSSENLNYFNNSDFNKIKNQTGKFVIKLDRKLGLQFKEKPTGKLFYEGKDIASCTGFVISKNQIITSAHCLDFFKSPNVLQNTYFELPDHSINTIKSKKYSIVSAKLEKNYSKFSKLFHRNFIFKLFYKADAIRNDLAIIETKEELPFEAFTAFRTHVALESPLLTYSFLSGISSEIKGSFKICELQEIQSLYKTICEREIAQGNSGGPLFTKINGVIYFIGVTSTREKTYLNKSYSYFFTPVDFQTIEQLMKVYPLQTLSKL